MIDKPGILETLECQILCLKIEAGLKIKYQLEVNSKTVKYRFKLNLLETLHPKDIPQTIKTEKQNCQKQYYMLERCYM